MVARAKYVYYLNPVSPKIANNNLNNVDAQVIKIINKMITQGRNAFIF